MRSLDTMGDAWTSCREQACEMQRVCLQTENPSSEAFQTESRHTGAVVGCGRVEVLTFDGVCPVFTGQRRLNKILRLGAAPPRLSQQLGPHTGFAARRTL
jgi:hypothetical protein